MNQSTQFIGSVVPLAMFIHPAKVFPLCTILVIFLFCLLNFFCQQKMPHVFPVNAHLWISECICENLQMLMLFWFDLKWTYLYEHIMQSCLTVVYLSALFCGSCGDSVNFWFCPSWGQLLIAICPVLLRGGNSPTFFSNTTISFIVLWAVTIHIFTPLWYDDYSNYQ